MVQHIDRGTHEPYDKELHGQAQEDHSELFEGYCGSGAILRSLQGDVQFLQAPYELGGGIGQGYTGNVVGSDRQGMVIERIDDFFS